MAFFGLSGNDFLLGDGGSDIIDGGLGNDVLRGGAGDDTIDGGAGANVLYGEAGDDTLIGGADRETCRSHRSRANRRGRRCRYESRRP